MAHAPQSTQPNTHWNIAATATAVAGIALVLLQPLWWEGMLFAAFQVGIVLWLREPKATPMPASGIDERLAEEIRELQIRLDEWRALVARLTPLWSEQIELAQTHIRAGQTTSDHIKRANQIIDAVRADMALMHRIAGATDASPLQADNWLAQFAAAQHLSS